MEEIHNIKYNIGHDIVTFSALSDDNFIDMFYSALGFVFQYIYQVDSPLNHVLTDTIFWINIYTPNDSYLVLTFANSSRIPGVSRLCRFSSCKTLTY